VWAGEVTPPQRRQVQSFDYAAGMIKLAKGQEAGRFNMGSTVVLLFGKERIRWEAGYQPETVVRLGRKIASII
jgi:phosphatidylserine decarboxylase